MFHEDHRQLLKAQVVLYDSVQKFAETFTEMHRKTGENLADLLAAQRNAADRMAALIITVDDLIRRPRQTS
jgi:hypothetical protein